MLAGHEELGVRCGAEGLFLACAALIEKRSGGYYVRSRVDLERLLRRAYNGKIGIDQVEPGLQRAASALNANAVGRAQSEAGCLPLPELPNSIAALRLEIEDLLIAAEPLREVLLRAGWDPDKHPRAGVPPNPGRFAPVGGSAALLPVAGSEEEERPEEGSDPLAEVRQQVWQSRLATLREIDTANPQLQSLHGPDWVPSQADLDTLDSTIRDAEVRRVTDKIIPNGKLIGTEGNSRNIREVPGGTEGAQDLFNYHRLGGTPYRSSPGLTVVQLPGNVGYVTFRPVSTSGPPAVDVNIPQFLLITIHFL